MNYDYQVIGDEKRENLRENIERSSHTFIGLNTQPDGTGMTVKIIDESKKK